MIFDKRYFNLCLSFIFFANLTFLLPLNIAIADQKASDEKSAKNALTNTSTKIVARAKYAETTFNFGNVTAGTVVTHSFEFKNVGNTDYKITRIVSGCGCTAASSSDDSIAPGEKGAVKVDFDTSGFSGAKTKIIRVYSNDFENPELSLTINGTVQSDVELNPSTILFGEMVHGAPAVAQEFAVNLRKDSGFKIASVVSYSKFLKIEPVSAASSVAGFSSNKYKVSVDSGIPVGELRDRILINLVKGSNNSTVTLPVLGRVTGTIALEPPQISYGIVEGTQVIERSVKLINKGSAPVEITSISSDTASIVPSFEIIEHGKNYIIHVKLDPAQVKTDVRALIEIKTSNPEMPSLYLSVFGVTPPKLDF